MDFQNSFPLLTCAWMTCSLYVLVVTVSCVRWTNIPEIWQQPQFPDAQRLTWSTSTLMTQNCKAPLYKILSPRLPFLHTWHMWLQANINLPAKCKVHQSNTSLFQKEYHFIYLHVLSPIESSSICTKHKTQKLFKLLAVYLFSKNVKTLTLLCSTRAFSFFLFLILFQMLCLNENMLLLNLRWIIDMSIQSLHMNT